MQTKPQHLVPKSSGQKAQPRMGCVGLLAWKGLKRPLAYAKVRISANIQMPGRKQRRQGSQRISRSSSSLGLCSQPFKQDQVAAISESEKNLLFSSTSQILQYNTSTSQARGLTLNKVNTAPKGARKVLIPISQQRS